MTASLVQFAHRGSTHQHKHAALSLLQYTAKKLNLVTYGGKGWSQWLKKFWFQSAMKLVPSRQVVSTFCASGTIKNVADSSWDSLNH